MSDIAKTVTDYLSHYGYLVPGMELASAILKFQDFWGFNLTGEADEKIVKAMNGLRCGCKDVYALREFGKWRKNKLTYKVVARDSGMSADEWDAILAEAWGNWKKVANLEIEQTDSNNADIVCSIGSGRQDQFDGPSGTLAWAELPSGSDRQLQMKFDSAETWVQSSRQRGIILLNVACHEFGHLLGLEHSRKQGALMAPYYAPGISEPQDNDDIPRIQALYGKPVNSSPAPQPTPTPTPTPDKKKLTIDITGDFAVQIPGYRLVKMQ